MTKQADKIAELQKRIPSDWEPLAKTPEELGAETVLETAVLCLLTRHLSETAASKTLKALRAFCPDWNELRVSQLQEYEGQIKSKSDDLRLEVAASIKTFLHEVFLKRHGFDLEFVREDLAEGARFLTQLNELGSDLSHYVLWHATNGELPLSLGLLRVLNRSGLMQRTSSVRKAQEALDKSLPAGGRALFGIRFGSLVEHCDAKKPTCWECAIHKSCPFGQRVVKEWEAQQKRLALQRKREEEAQRKADEARRRQEERERKKAEAEARRKAERLARQDAKARREAERKAKAEERKRLAAKKKAEAEAKRVAAKKAAAKKAAAKKAAAKKAAAKKAAAKKAAAKKAAAKKAAAKKKAVKKKSTTRKKSGSAKKAKKKVKRKVSKKRPSAKTRSKASKTRSRSGTKSRAKAGKRKTRRR